MSDSSVECTHANNDDEFRESWEGTAESKDVKEVGAVPLVYDEEREGQ